MSSKKTTYIQDIRQYLDRIPYGDVQITVKRRNNKTVQVHTNSVETTRHKDNQSAFDEIDQLLKALEAAEYDGNITFTLNLKQGQIKEIGHYNVKQTNY